MWLFSLSLMLLFVSCFSIVCVSRCLFVADTIDRQLKEYMEKKEALTGSAAGVGAAAYVF